MSKQKEYEALVIQAMELLHTDQAAGIIVACSEYGGDNKRLSMCASTEDSATFYVLGKCIARNLEHYPEGLVSFMAGFAAPNNEPTTEH